VPGNTARWITGEILAHGRVRRRQLGVAARTVPLPRALVRRLDLLADQAVEVVQVSSGSPADRSGIRADDVIIALHGRIVTSVDDLHRLLSQLPMTGPLNLTVIRNGKPIDLEIVDDG
jgi:S1-C subfamily serine protease